MAGPLIRDRVKETTTTTGTGTVDLGGAATGFRTFVAGVGNGNSCYYCIEAGAEWEVGIGVVTDAAPDTLSRAVILSSSNAGAAVSFSAGTKNVFLTFPASIAEPDNSLCCGRPTLASGYPVYNPQDATPSATDTTAETCDFAAAHGWVSGTKVTVDATGGGLTAGTVYYINATDADTVSFHTTLADALAATSKVNLTASITAKVLALGVANTTVYFTPWMGNRVALWNGSGWVIHTLTEVSLALGTVTADLPYDFFLYDNAGTLTLEKVAWTSGTARATDIVLQDGVWCKSGALTRRLVFTLRTVSTTAAEDSQGWVGIKPIRGLSTAHKPSRVRREMYIFEATGSWTYATNTWRQANAATTNQFDLVCCLPDCELDLTLMVGCQDPNTGAADIAIGEDSTTAPHRLTVGARAFANSINISLDQPAFLRKLPAAGNHYYAWLERSPTAVTVTYLGDTSGFHRSGMVGSIEC